MLDPLDALLADVRPAFPQTPDLAPRVIEGVHRRGGARRLRLALAAAVLATLLAAGAVAAGALGVGPLRILFGQGLPAVTVPDSPLGARLALGRRIDATDAQAAGVPILVPQALAQPDEVYLSELGIVSLVYEADGHLRPLGQSGIGLLVMAIPGDLDPELVSKIVVESRAAVEPVTVRGRAGYWVSGAPHVLRYVIPGEGQGMVTSRLVGDALVWQEAGAVFRIESALGRDATIRLADSLAPLR